VKIVEEAKGGLTIQASDGYLVGLDAELDADLRAEGLAREVVSRVQRLRRDAGLAVSDRIDLAVGGSAEIEAAVRAHEAYVAGETLAVALGTGEDAARDLDRVEEAEIDGETVVVGLSRLADGGESARGEGRAPGEREIG
jgi:isoleucyl-tRNA synthetase